MDLGLKNKTAIILGGTRGIGRAIAETFASEGTNVAICARNADQVKEAVAALSAKGVKATGASVDVTNAEALQSWIKSVGEEFGQIDVLISNAGAMAQGNDPKSWSQNFNLDVLGCVNAFEAAEPYLAKAAKANGDAAMIIIASVSGAVADQASSYGPIKAALIHMAKGLSRQHAAAGIRVNTVSPGMVYFEGGVWHMVEQNMPEFYAKALRRVPSGRCATPEEIASATVFLASPLSSYTTGVNLVIDGATTNRVNF